MTPRPRCAWAGTDPLMRAYHDTEWGRPVHDDRVLFEFLVLEGAQAGLSWSTILKRREHYRAAYAGFDPGRVARFDARKVAAMLQDEGLVRNRAKIASSVENARLFLEVAREHGSFDAFAWSFVGGRPIRRRPKTMRDVPATSPESDALAKALKAKGFRFVGSTICYAFLQACGLVNDHTEACFLGGGRALRRRRA